MEFGTMSNASRTMQGGQTNTTGAGKGRSGANGEGSTEPVMRVAPVNGPSAQSAPVAEPLTPYEMNMMAQRIGQVVYGLGSIINDLNKAMGNPSLKPEQQDKIAGVIADMSPLVKKIFNAGMRLNSAFLPSKRKR